MSPQQCASFINSCTGYIFIYRDNCDQYDSRIKDLYDQYDSNKKGYLSQEDFFQFYKDACEKKPRVVWTNLQNKNIQNDLTPANDPVIQDDLQARTYLADHKVFLQRIEKFQHHPKIFYLLCRIPPGGQTLTLNEQETWYWDFKGDSLDRLEDPCKGIRDRVFEMVQKNQFRDIKSSIFELYQQDCLRKKSFFDILYVVGDEAFLSLCLKKIKNQH